MTRLLVSGLSSALLALALASPPAAIAHGDDETSPAAAQKQAREQAIGEGKSAREVEQAAQDAGGEAEVAALSRQPARALAQQAHALIHIRGDRHEAGVRLAAALASEDRRQVDEPTLRRAREALETGTPASRVLALIDEALSKPLGAKSGKLFHGAGREFEPATGDQEVIAIVAGAVLLLLGIALLARPRAPRPAP